MTLVTAEDVIGRAGIKTSSEFEDVTPMSEYAGFYAFRRYPRGSALASVLTSDGRPAVRCYLSFIVKPPTGGISRIDLHAWLWRRWLEARLLAPSRELDQAPPGHPDAPTPPCAAVLARTRKPVDLDTIDARPFFYDHAEDIFHDDEGNVFSPAQILEEMYSRHCRTLRLGFRIRWNLGSAVRWVISRAVWRGQDAAMWALFKFYDVELSDKKLREGGPLNPLHKYKPSDFRRATDKPGERSQFFGFQSSQKSFFTNLIVVAITCLVLYWRAPFDRGLLGWIYNNTALSTAALVLCFLVADSLGPWLLIRAVCVLSRLRDAVMFLVRKVRV